MYLWQIRHIPNCPQSLLKRAIFLAAFLASFVTGYTTTPCVYGQAVDAAKTPVEPVKNETAALEFLGQVRQELQKHQTVRADIVQNVSIAEQQFKVKGQYVSSGNPTSGMKLMLTYSVVPDQGARGEMLEVCDGKELWTMLTLPDSKRVTHRDVLQIQKAAAAANSRNLSESALSLELGLGGLTALLASLERTMDFDAMKQEEIEGQSRTIIQGRWKKEVIQRFPKEKEDLLPAFVPDLVRVYVNAENLFPTRILYLKRQPEKKTLKPLLSLEFQNVELNEPVSDDLFVFEIPKDVIPEDITKIYLDRLTPPAAPPAAKK